MHTDRLRDWLHRHRRHFYHHANVKGLTIAVGIRERGHISSDTVDFITDTEGVRSLEVVDNNEEEWRQQDSELSCQAVGLLTQLTV